MTPSTLPPTKHPPPPPQPFDLYMTSVQQYTAWLQSKAIYQDFKKYFCPLPHNKAIYQDLYFCPPPTTFFISLLMTFNNTYLLIDNIILQSTELPTPPPPLHLPVLRQNFDLIYVLID